MATVIRGCSATLHDCIADIAGHTDACAGPPDTGAVSSGSRSKQSNTALTDAEIKRAIPGRWLPYRRCAAYQRVGSYLPQTASFQLPWAELEERIRYLTRWANVTLEEYLGRAVLLRASDRSRGISSGAFMFRRGRNLTLR